MWPEHPNFFLFLLLICPHDSFSIQKEKNLEKDECNHHLSIHFINMKQRALVQKLFQTDAEPIPCVSELIDSETPVLKGSLRGPWQKTDSKPIPTQFQTNFKPIYINSVLIKYQFKTDSLFFWEKILKGTILFFIFCQIFSQKNKESVLNWYLIKTELI